MFERGVGRLLLPTIDGPARAVRRVRLNRLVIKSGCSRVPDYQTAFARVRKVSQIALQSSAATATSSGVRGRLALLYAP